MTGKNDEDNVLSGIRITPASPAIRSKQAARLVNNEHIEVLTMAFTDRIMINITMQGKLGQIVHTMKYRSHLSYIYRSLFPYEIHFPQTITAKTKMSRKRPRHISIQDSFLVRS